MRLKLFLSLISIFLIIIEPTYGLDAANLQSSQLPLANIAFSAADMSSRNPGDEKSLLRKAAPYALILGAGGALFAIDKDIQKESIRSRQASLF